MDWHCAKFCHMMSRAFLISSLHTKNKTNLSISISGTSLSISSLSFAFSYSFCFAFKICLSLCGSLGASRRIFISVSQCFFIAGLICITATCGVSPSSLSLSLCYLAFTKMCKAPQYISTTMTSMKMKTFICRY